MNHKINQLGQPLRDRGFDRYRRYSEKDLNLSRAVYTVINDSFQTHRTYLGATFSNFWNDLHRHLRFSS